MFPLDQYGLVEYLTTHESVVKYVLITGGYFALILYLILLIKKGRQ
jgi:hypothetical protein